MKKYGRTYHLPMSPGATSDDKIMSDLSQLYAADEVVITEKMDGENTTIHARGCHARSPDSRYHPSRDWMKAFAAAISPNLSADERIVGEYLFARHTIGYNALPSYFMGFAWIVGDRVQSWDDTPAKFADIGIVSVPTLYRGPFSDQVLEATIEQLDLETQEGFVVRATSAFQEREMPTHMGKYVRADHVESEKHWMQMEIVRNGLA